MKLPIEIISLMKIHKQDCMYKALIYLNSLVKAVLSSSKAAHAEMKSKQSICMCFCHLSPNVTMMHQNQRPSSAKHCALQSLRVVVNWFNKCNNSIHVGFSSPYLVNRKEGIKCSCFSTTEMELNPMTLEQ